MNVQPVPAAPMAGADRVDARSGDGDRLRRPLPAARPGGQLRPGLGPGGADARDPARSRRFTNAEGIEQGTCIHLGECDIGCPVLARNTLDMNYIPRAERHGAEVRPLHIVRSIERAGDGYRVHADRIEGRRLIPVTEEARIVVVAAGSLGSTELLLRCRDVGETLPDLPRSIGRGWSSNGDFLTIGLHKGRRVDPTRGPTITSAIDFRDGSVDGRSFIIEDGGFPDVVGRWMSQASTRWSWFRRERILYGGFQKAVQESAPFESVMPWFAQGRDAADGQLELRRRWWGLFGRLRAVARLGRDRLAPDDRGDHRDAPPAGRGDRRQADRAVELVVARLPDHAASARRLQHGHRPRGQRRRPPRRGLGPPQPLRRRRLDRPRGARGEPVTDDRRAGRAERRDPIEEGR